LTSSLNFKKILIILINNKKISMIEFFWRLGNFTIPKKDVDVKAI